MEKAIITNGAVDKSFDGADCLLKRSIISAFKESGKKRYIVRTERCKYVPQERPVLGQDGQPQLDDDGNELFETIEVLKVINKKDNDTVQKFSYNEIESLYDAVKDQVNLEDGYMNFEDHCEQLALLLKTKQDKPWGIAPEKWILL